MKTYVTERAASILRNIAAVVFVAVALFMLFGCASGSLQTVKAAIPLVCQETEPARPIMPTDRLMRGASLDSFVQAATAEIERRQGYETKLVTALRACIAPIQP